MTAGVQTPTPGSPLATLGRPVSAMRDAMWNASSTPVAELLLAGPDPTATYDLTCLASRLGVADALFSELRVSSHAVLLGSVAALPAQGRSRTFAVPVGSEGSFVVQAQVLAPSLRTGHAFTTTDGHELRVDLGGNVRLVRRRPR